MADFSQSEENGIITLSITGEIDAGSSVELDQAIQRCSAAADKIIVDCSGLDYISSAGLGVFMSYVDEFQTNNIRMVIFGLSDRVAHTFSLLGLADLLTIVKGRSEALQSIHGK